MFVLVLIRREHKILALVAYDYRSTFRYIGSIIHQYSSQDDNDDGLVKYTKV